MAKIPDNNQIIKDIYEAGAEGVRIITQTSRILSLEIICRRDFWAKEIEPVFIDQYGGEIRGIQKVSGDPGTRAVETGGGTYRYSIVLVRD